MILALITVVQCEDCHLTVVLQDLAQHEAFEESWHDGFRYQFCPTCRVKPQAEDRIEEDLATAAKMSEVARKVRGKEYVN